MHLRSLCRWALVAAVEGVRVLCGTLADRAEKRVDIGVLRERITECVDLALKCGDRRCRAGEDILFAQRKKTTGLRTILKPAVVENVLRKEEGKYAARGVTP